MQEVVTPNAKRLDVLRIVVLEVAVYMMRMQTFRNATRLAEPLAMLPRPPVMCLPVFRMLPAVGTLQIAELSAVEN